MVSVLRRAVKFEGWELGQGAGGALSTAASRDLLLSQLSLPGGSICRAAIGTSLALLLQPLHTRLRALAQHSRRNLKRTHTRCTSHLLRAASVLACLPALLILACRLQANMHVRFLDWSESVERLRSRQLLPEQQHPQQPASLDAAGSSPSSSSAAGAATAAVAASPQRSRPSGHSSGIPSPQRASQPGSSPEGCSGNAAPGVDPERQFSLVLGTDILYEWPQVEMVACVLRHRLAPGGRALLCCAVREQVRRREQGRPGAVQWLVVDVTVGK